MAAFDPKWLLFWCRRGAWTSFRVIDVRTSSLCKLLKEKSSLESHLLNASMIARDSKSDSIITFFNLIHSLSKLNTLSSVSLLYRRREYWWYTSCADWSSCRRSHYDLRMEELFWGGSRCDSLLERRRR